MKAVNLLPCTQRHNLIIIFDFHILGSIKSALIEHSVYDVNFLNYWWFIEYFVNKISFYSTEFFFSDVFVYIHWLLSAWLPIFGHWIEVNWLLFVNFRVSIQKNPNNQQHFWWVHIYYLLHSHYTVLLFLWCRIVCLSDKW